MTYHERYQTAQDEDDLLAMIKDDAIVAVFLGNNPDRIKAIEDAGNKVAYERGGTCVSERLRKCPFCMGKAELLIVPGRMTKWVVRCTKCYANNGTFASDHDAVEVWNRRVPEVDE